MIRPGTLPVYWRSMSVDPPESTYPSTLSPEPVAADENGHHLQFTTPIEGSSFPSMRPGERVHLDHLVLYRLDA